MEPAAPQLLRIGEWIVDPVRCVISRSGVSTPLEVRSMRLLMALVARPGEIVSSEELLAEVWSDVTVSQDSVYQAVASLRRLLGDDPKQPSYIATVPRLGYRLVAPVSAYIEVESQPSALVRKTQRYFVASIAAFFVLAAGMFLYLRLSHVQRVKPTVAIAVLPFQDLTQGMGEGEFADGMTEELIDKLSKVSGLRIPAPSAVFFYKDKQVALGDMARALGVDYVVDGSIRKSGDRVRIATRLVRAQSGYVIWSETYDRPFHDLIRIQDEIAGRVVSSCRSLDFEGGGSGRRQIQFRLTVYRIYVIRHKTYPNKSRLKARFRIASTAKSHPS